MPVRVKGLGENMAQNTVEVNQPHQWNVDPLSKLLPCRLLLVIPDSQTETCSMQTPMSLSCSASPSPVSECRGQDTPGRRNNMHKCQEAAETTRLYALKGCYYLYVEGGTHKLKEISVHGGKKPPWVCWWPGLSTLSHMKLNGIGQVVGFLAALVSSFFPPSLF